MSQQLVTVLGVGQLGLPISIALAKSGNQVTVVDKDEVRQSLAAGHGLQTLSKKASGKVRLSFEPLKWLITVLPDDETFAAAVHGDSLLMEGGFIDQMGLGSVHICIGTIGIAQAKATAKIHQARGQYFIAAPVFGRPDEAWACDLTALFGLPDDLPESLKSEALLLLGSFAPRIHPLNSPEAAFAVKLAGNLLIASAIASMTEAFGLAQNYGASAADVQKIITGKLFKGPVYEGVGRVVAEACQMTKTTKPTDSDGTNEGTPGFTVRLGLKDLSLAQAAAQGISMELQLATAVQKQFQCAAERGYSNRDWAELPAFLPNHFSPELDPNEFV